MANFSRKRQAVLQALRNTKAHPNAETIYRTCKEIEPSISLGTVYRNLIELERGGEIVRVATIDGKERYDGDTSEHWHAICPKCHRIDDVDCSETLRAALDQERLRGGYDACRLTFWRTCPACARQEK